MLLMAEQLQSYPTGYQPVPSPNYYNSYQYYGTPVNQHLSFNPPFSQPNYSHYYFSQGPRPAPAPSPPPPPPPQVLQKPPQYTQPPPQTASYRAPVQTQRPSTTPPVPARPASNTATRPASNVATEPAKPAAKDPVKIKSPFKLENKLDIYLLGKFPLNKKSDSLHQDKKHATRVSNKERCLWNRQLQNDFLSSRMAVRSYMRSHQLFFRSPYRGNYNYDVKSGKHFYQTVK